MEEEEKMKKLDIYLIVLSLISFFTGFCVSLFVGFFTLEFIILGILYGLMFLSAIRCGINLEREKKNGKRKSSL